jgi:lambda family phage portal protein
MPYALRVQVLEADRVGNPAGAVDTGEVAGGIRRQAGRVQAYHLYQQHPGSLTLNGDRFKGEWMDALGRSGRRRVLHHLKRLRPEQSRGVPYLAPVMGLFKLLGSYTDAEVKAAVVSAYLTVFIEQQSAPNAAPVFTGVTSQTQSEMQTSGNIELAPAAIIGLGPGEQAKAVTPGRPNPAFGDFVQAVLDQLGAGTFIGSEMLMKKFSTSYTAARAAFLDAWKHLLDMRTLVARSFCQPVFETWLAEAVSLGRVTAPGFFSDPLLRWAYTRASWIGDSQGSLNPKDEVTAYTTAVDQRLVTRERAAWELFGEGFADQYPTMRAEHQQLAEDGMLPVPKAGAAAPQPGKGPAQPAAQPGAEPAEDDAGEDPPSGPADAAAQRGAA